MTGCDKQDQTSGLQRVRILIALVPAYLQTTTFSLAAPKPGLNLWLVQQIWPTLLPLTLSPSPKTITL